MVESRCLGVKTGNRESKGTTGGCEWPKHIAGWSKHVGGGQNTWFRDVGGLGG
jgi:hypothetical protein